MDLTDPRWETARQAELESLRKFDVFDEIKIGDEPPNAVISRCRWLYVLKGYPHEKFVRNDEEAIAQSRFKARCIVSGFDDPIEKIESYYLHHQ